MSALSRRREVSRKYERTHGKAGTELHGRINVLSGSVAAFDHSDGLEHVGYEQAVDDEAVKEVEVSSQRFVTTIWTHPGVSLQRTGVFFMVLHRASSASTDSSSVFSVRMTST